MAKAHDDFKRWLESTGRKKAHVAADIGCRPETLSQWLGNKVVPTSVARRCIEYVTGGAVNSGDWE